MPESPDSAHTPGPWKVSRRFEIYSDTKTPGVGGTYVGTTRGNGELPESINRRCEADARLMAAAPDMYGLIRKCYQVLHAGVWEVDETDQDVCEQINDVMWHHFGDAWRGDRTVWNPRAND